MNNGNYVNAHQVPQLKFSEQIIAVARDQHLKHQSWLINFTNIVINMSIINCNKFRYDLSYVYFTFCNARLKLN